MSGPAIGEPDPDRAAPARTGFVDTAGGILVLLALGLTFRLIIAYLLPGSGFKVDLNAFQFWASDLADNGLFGFYSREFFHDYTPGYLYVLWLVGGVANVLGTGVGDLIKIPPIVGDLALAYLVWSMTRELGGSERAARLGALLVILNPVTWFDSVVWGQVDSVGVVFLLLALRELWRDRPERAAILATLAALVKPQLGILIPIVAIVVIRRAFWPQGGFGLEDPPERRAWTTAWEERVRGPIRVVTTGLAGLLTAIVVSLPFGLSFTGLIAQIFKTAGGYPYLSVNAFNPWALLIQTTADGREESIALTRSWICDSTILASPPTEFRIGPWVIPELGSAGSAVDVCPDGVMIGAFPAVLVGAALFLIATMIVLAVVARRPDRITMIVALAIMSLAFFVLPTRVHERYLFPLAAIGAILAAVSLRWRLAYVLSAAATFANMYVVLTTYYHDNPQISDWLGIGPTLAAPWGVAVASITQALVLGWAFFQLREEAVEGIAEDVVFAGDGYRGSRLPAWLGRALPEPDTDDEDPLDHPADVETDGRAAGQSAWLAGEMAADAVAPVAVAPVAALTPGTVLPAWDQERDAGSLGPVGWLRARLGDSPVRADRSRILDVERGGRLGRLDVWVLAVLAISLLTVRMWRLDEPYQMHFDEVYHPRTATEFLQHWRYGQSHDIYEWTHPHLAKYGMALGLMAFGEDKVSGTSDLGVAVLDAAIEPRRDDGLDETRIEGDRVWVATGSEVRAYDLATRGLAGTLALPDVVALAYDRTGKTLYVGTRGGDIRVVDVGTLDDTRRGPPAAVESRAYMSVGGPIERLFVTRDGERLAVVLRAGFETADPASSTIVVIDAIAAVELGRPSLRGVGQITAGVSDDRLAVATADGVTFIETVAGTVSNTLDLGGPVGGIVGINDIENDPIYATVATAEGPHYAVIIAKRGEEPRIDRTIPLPGDRAGRAYFDLTTRMVHLEGSVPATAGRSGADTIYVIEPHANAVYADAALPFAPAVMVVDENEKYPSTDRQQILAFGEGGQVAAVEVGRHAYAWRVPGVIAGVLMALLLYVLARILFQRRMVAVLVGLIALLDGMLFAQSRIGMNDAYVGLGIVAAYTIFAALWLNPGNTRRHWLAFAIGAPVVGLFLGFALAAKWVAAYAIGGLGILVLTRSALGRVILLAGLVVVTTVLGYVAISVAEGQGGGNYVFLVIMVALVVAAVLANVLHPIAWTWEELRFAVGAPIAAGAAAILYGLVRGDAAGALELGPVAVTPIELGLLGLLLGGAVYTGFVVLGRYGFGPLALPPEPDDPAAILDPPAEAPTGWLRLGAGWGLPAVWLAISLLVIPIAVYVVSYIPWAQVESHQIVAGAEPGTGWPPGNTGQTLLDLTSSMYRYHDDLSSAHPASSPWWAWVLDLKPVWFYQEGFAGATSGAIYDAGNLVAWWLAIPALAFVAWQSFRRRNAALALIAIGFACQWISWARIDRAAFQYHYYTALPFVFLALAYFLAELWHGTSRRIWLLARLSAAAAILGPFGLWLLHRPLCAIARVNEIVEGSQACPTLIPDVSITPRAVAIAVVVGVGVLLLLRELLALSEEGDPDRLDAERDAGGWRAMLARVGLGSRWATAALIGVATSIAFLVVSTALQDSEGIELTNIPVEPIALFVTLALSPVAGYVATARDSRRFVLGALGAMVLWFVLWYPNISGLPLPAALHNAYQGFLPTYLYPFQFWVLQGDRPAAPALFAIGPAVMLLAITFMAIVVGYSAWSWRIALAERRRDHRARDAARLTTGAD
ncbi:MAG TPA: phospholipid carrier-dependent glycosyltransferase [Candidatus Limnocylindria bacterium]|nr:phospholipid carrier-dependent glycosyltransferase [Candidatus Limnocylindria bacterium]